MYAIISTGGKQYKVQSGDVISVELLDGKPGDTVTFDKILAAGEGAELKTGTPTIDGAKVEGEIQSVFRGEKLIVFKFKRRKGFRKKNGHRQNLMSVKIGSISI